MEPAFKKVSLYGGAISANVPSGFVDVSTIRQVPDHQEVYLSATGFSSLIFDLGERVAHTSTDQEALRYHFDDIVDEKDTKKIWSVESSGSSVLVPNLPHNTPVLTLVATTTPPPLEPGQELRPNVATSVTILMTLIRLVPQSTDMVIKLNIPVIPAEESDEEIDFENGKFGTAVEKGRRIVDEVRKTLEVVDWGLFVEEKEGA